MKILILDDDLIRHGLFRDNFGYGLHDLTMVTTVEQAISKLSLHEYDAVSLDHDLGENLKTGYDFIREVVEMALNEKFDLSAVTDFYVHSQNPVGAENIKLYWFNARRVLLNDT